MRLHNRIVVPFVMAAVVTTAAAALLVLMAVSRAFEARVSTQVLNTASVVTRGGFATTPAILRSVKAITGADVVTFTDSGAILASTVEDAHQHDVAAAMVSAPAQADLGATGLIVRDVACDTPCLVAYQRVANGPARVAVIAEATEVSAATRAVARTIAVTGAFGLVALWAASRFVARRVTVPLERLGAFANAVALEPRAPIESRGEQGPKRAAEGDDEVGRLGRAFNQMLDRLDRSQSSLVRHEKLALAGMLAARVAHDIRNPLAAIKMETQLLRDRLRGDEQGQQLVNAVLHNIGTVESVILDLIELARPGQLNLRTASLNDVVRDVLQRLDPQLAHQKIYVTTDLSESLPSLRLDPDRFKLALTNLIVNAAEAMPGGGRIEIRTIGTPGGSTATLEVCDDGTGIEPALVDKVFDPFVSSKPGGVGLGLVNARAVVELHGGRIELGPHAPRGTRATVTLPVGAV
jgi:signal transduction histidine kinase